MKSRLKILLFIVLIGWTLIVPSETAQAAGACGGFGDAFIIQSAKDKPNAVGALPAFCTASAVATVAINLLLGLSGVVSVIFLMLGGFWYLTAAGNEEQAEKGRKVLTNAIIGLVVIIMSFALVRIAINLLTSSAGGAATPAPAAATPAAGLPPATPPASPNPAAGNQGNPLAISTSDMYHYITQQDVDNFANTNQVLSLTINTKEAALQSGATFTSTITSSDRQLIAEIYKFCGGANPELEFVVNGDTVNIGTGNYYTSGSNEWSAIANYPKQLQKDDNFVFHICGQSSIVYTYTVTTLR